MTSSCPRCMRGVLVTPSGELLDLEVARCGVLNEDGSTLSIRDIQTGLRGHLVHHCDAPQPHQEVLPL